MSNLGEFAQFAQTARDQIPPSSVSWEGSPFAWMRPHSPRTKSKMAVDIAQAWLQARGVEWMLSDDTLSHFTLPRLGRVDVHLALLGKEGRFEFAQLREPGLGTDAIWLIGVEPLRVRLWGAKPSSVSHLPTYSIHKPGYHHCTFDPDDPPEWMKLIESWGDPTLGEL